MVVEGDIAIVGASCRFPGANSIGSFWSGLVAGRESIVRKKNLLSSSNNIEAYSVLSGYKDFDYNVFKLNRREASLIDPQHRVFLKCCYEALDEANFLRHRQDYKIGVFGGVGASTYLNNNLLPTFSVGENDTLLHSNEGIELHLANDKDYFCSRVSHLLGLTGPAVNIQAACATSLYAVHYAIQSILMGEADIALAGGAFVTSPVKFSYEAELGMPLSSDGFCRPFDHLASGTILGNGAGVVALRALETALENNDNIIAVISSSAIGNDGDRNRNFTAPSVAGQAEVIHESLSLSGVEPEQIGFVEGHATATELGDPIEVEALNRAFDVSNRNRCALGGVKSNIGHLSWASGIASLIKVAKSLQEGIIPPTLHFSKPNVNIPFEDGPFFVNNATIPWPSISGLRYAGVSAFGLGGNNAHLTMRQHEVLQPEKSFHYVQNPNSVLETYLTVSAESEPALRAYLQSLENWMDSNPNVGFEAVKNALLLKPTYQYGVSLPASSKEKFKHALSLRIKEDIKRWPRPKDPEVVGLFSGHVDIPLRKIAKIYRDEPVFKDTISNLEKSFMIEFGCSIHDFYNYEEDDPFVLKDNVLNQALGYATQVSLFELWVSKGIKFNKLYGHSLGEIAAAYAGGVFSLTEGFRFVVERGRLIDKAPEGAMLIVYETVDTIKSYAKKVKAEIDFSVFLGHETSIVSGIPKSIETLENAFDRDSISYRKIQINRAGHSRLMEVISERLKVVASDINFANSNIEIASNLTGELTTDAIANPDYWANQICKPVQLAKCSEVLFGNNSVVAIEMGVQPALSILLPRGSNNTKHVRWVFSLPEISGHVSSFEFALCDAFDAGIDVPSMTVREMGNNLADKALLPPYQFDEQECWVERRGENEVNLPAPFYKELLFEETWKPQCFKVNLEPRDTKTTTWVICADEGAEWKTLLSEVREKTKHIKIIFKEGDPNAEFGEGKYSVSLADEICFESIISTFSINEPIVIVNLWPLDDSYDVGVNAKNYGKIKSISLPLVSLLQSISNFDLNAKVISVTRHAQLITGDTKFNCFLSLFSGLVRTARLEMPSVMCRMVDIDNSVKAYVAEILEEVDSPCDEDQVAFRSKNRFVQRLRALPHSDAPADISAINLNGVTIVTGGGTGLGRLAVNRLIELGSKKIILLGRRVLAQEQKDWISLEKSKGIDIIYLQADISEVSSVSKLTELIHQIGMPVNGVVHAAGVIRDKLFNELSWEDINIVSKSKVLGLINLEKCLEAFEANLQFFICYSSASAMLGNAGQTNYAIANSIMEGIARKRQMQGRVATTIAWGPWIEEGLISGQKDVIAHLNSTGMGGLSTTDGMAVFDEFVLGKSACIGVLANNWPKFIKFYGLNTRLYFEEVIFKNSNLFGKDTSEDIPKTTVDSADNIVEKVASLIGRLVGETAQSILNDPDRTLKNIGLSSLGIVQLRNKLRQELSIQLPAVIFAENPSFNELIDKLLSTSSNQNIVHEVSQLDTINSELMTFQQERWLSLVQKGYGQRVIPILFKYKFSSPAFKSALEAMVKRHNLLRYSYRKESFVVLETASFFAESSTFYSVLDLSNTKNKHEVIFSQVDKARQNMPDPTAGPTWSVQCLILGADQFIVLLSAQHIDFDGVSISVFTNEIEELYECALQNLDLPTIDVVQYCDFAEHQKRYLNSQLYLEDRAFFEGLYSSATSLTCLSPRHDLTKTQPFISERYSIRPEHHIKNDLLKAADRAGLSEFSILLAAYSRLVSRISKQSDVIINMISGGRGHERFQKTIGPFTFANPLRIIVPSDATISLAKQCSAVVHGINSRVDFPVTKLMECANVFKNLPHDTYFSDASINYLNYDKSKKDKTDTQNKTEIIETLGPVNNEDLQSVDSPKLPRIPGFHLIIDRPEGDFRFNFWYHKHRFEKTMVKEWGSNFLKALNEELVILLEVDK